jgi:two-component system, response regulator YesN
LIAVLAEIHKKDISNINTETFIDSISNKIRDLENEVFFINGQRIFLIFWSNASDDLSFPSYLHKILSLILKRLKSEYAIDLALGLSKEFDCFKNIPEVYNRLDNLLKHKFYYPLSSIIVERDLIEFKEFRNENPMYEIDKFKKAIFDRDIHSINQMLDDYVKCSKDKNILPDNVIKSSLHFLTKIVEFFNSIGGKLENLYDTKTIVFKQIIQVENIYDIYDILADFLNKVIQFLDETKSMRHKKEVMEVLKMINNNYYSEITLKDISDKINISYNYMVTIFKNEMGIGFNEYLCKIRIEKAKELLYITSYKIYEIAEMVGYNDAAYFCTVFKKMVGITPLDFRTGKQ